SSSWASPPPATWWSTTRPRPPTRECGAPTTGLSSRGRGWAGPAARRTSSTTTRTRCRPHQATGSRLKPAQSPHEGGSGASILRLVSEFLSWVAAFQRAVHAHDDHAVQQGLNRLRSGFRQASVEDIDVAAGLLAD